MFERGHYLLLVANEEEPVTDLNVEMSNKAEEEAVAKQAETERWDGYGAYAVVARDAATSRPLSLVWVLETRSLHSRRGFARDLSAECRSTRTSCSVPSRARRHRR